MEGTVKKLRLLGPTVRLSYIFIFPYLAEVWEFNALLIVIHAIGY